MDPPVRVHSFVWEPQAGRLSLTVACELALRLVHGAEAQFVEPIRFYDDDLAAIADADFRAPYKPRTDVLLVGHAYAAASEPEVDRLLVRMRIGDYGKAVWVVGDRLWTRDAGRLVPSAPRKFRRMLLSPERAPRSAENPRGVDAEQMPIEHRIAVANIEPAVRGQEAHVGPVAPGSARRASLVHPITAPWIRALLSGQRAGPPPEGFPFAYFNIAPVDQQIDGIALGSAVVLEHMHPERTVFSSRMPASRPRAFVFDPRTRAHVEIELRCDTVWIDADREMVSLVFRGVVPIHHADAATQVSVRVESFAREEPSIPAGPGGGPSTLSLPASQAPAAPTFGKPLAAPVFGSPQPAAPTFARAPGAPSFGGAAAPPIFEAPGGAPRFAGLPFAQRAGHLPPPPAPPTAENESTTAGETVRLARLDLDEARAQRAARARQFITQEIDLEAPIAATPFEGKVEHKVEDETTQSFRAREMARVLGGADLDDSSADAPTPVPFEHPEPTSSTNVTAVSDMSGIADLAPVRIVKLKPPRISATPPPPLPPKPPARANGEARTNGHDAKASVPELRPPAKVPPPETRPSARLGALKLGMGKLQSSDPKPDDAKSALTAPEPAKPAIVPAPPARVPPPPLDPVTADPVTADPGEPHATSSEAPPAPKEELTTDELSEEGTSDALPRPVREEFTETSASPRRGLEARTLEEAEAEADRDAFEFPLPPSDGFEVDGVTLEHCAAIRAAMAMPGAERAAVLAKNDLDDATWTRIEKAHMARIDQETSKGVMDLLSRYDASYVAAQDKLRRPIGVKEYARIVHARGAGALAETMAELAIPRSELMRLDRVWKLRRAAYPGVDKAIDAAVAALAEERR